ncbi:hypothetical protein GWI33_009903, partial [Rhynchophorus ferrugineus]
VPEDNLNYKCAIVLPAKDNEQKRLAPYVIVSKNFERLELDPTNESNSSRLRDQRKGGTLPPPPSTQTAVAAGRNGKEKRRKKFTKRPILA